MTLQQVGVTDVSIAIIVTFVMNIIASASYAIWSVNERHLKR